MRPLRTTLRLSLVAVTALLLGDAPRAEACGGCFVPQAIQPSEASVVTDHRMALSMSLQQTVLWDQIRYSGDPREFAWVLPVRAGARIEVANDEFFTALDASTQPLLYQPSGSLGVYACALGGCSGDTSASSSPDVAPSGGVEVLSESVVGPYEQVTLRATDDAALTAWLTKNDFQIPPAIAPTIDAYVREGFDFIALKLRPTCGERAMRPVRVVTPGADPSLPLRMVAAGVGANVGITLYVIAEGRYEPQNFPHATMEEDRLRWDRLAGRSNYEELSQEIMGRADGHTWLTEYSEPPLLPAGSGFEPPRYGARQTPPALADAYYGRCAAYQASGAAAAIPTFTPCAAAADAGNADAAATDAAAADAAATDAATTDAAATDDDAGEADAATSDASTHDGGSIGDGETPDDAGAPAKAVPQPGAPVDVATACAYLDDLDTALAGLHREDVWVTRLRAVLPANALAEGDLRLAPTLLPDGRADSTGVSSVHYVQYYTDEDSATTSRTSGCVGAPKRHRVYGSWVLVVTFAIGGIAVLRRRRRR